MSLYGEYIKEIYGKEIVETKMGFATYFFLQDGSCYLEEIFVLPEFRRSNVARNLADEVARIAKEKGSKLLIGSVDVTHKNAQGALLLLVAYGFKIDSVLNNGVIFKKEIK